MSMILNEAEYEKIRRLCLDAEEMRRFWENDTLETLSKAIRGAESLSYRLSTTYCIDTAIIQNIVDSLVNLEKAATERYEYWDDECKNLDRKLEECEAE